MIGINSLTPDIDEVMQISGKAVTLPVLDYLHELTAAWIKKKGEDKAASVDSYFFITLLSTAFAAGYMQGKREQRNQQEQHRAKELEQIRTSELHQYRASAKMYIDLVDSTAGAKAMSDRCFTVWKQWKYKDAWKDGEGAST